jgi:hypothetical protein
MGMRSIRSQAWPIADHRHQFVVVNIRGLKINSQAEVPIGIVHQCS